MSPFHYLLVALDGSEESFNALRYAVLLGRKIGANIKAMSVVQMKGEVSSALSLFLGMEDLFKKGAEAILKKAEGLASELGVEITTLIRKGDPITEIIDAALMEGCNPIVIGKTGKTGLTRALLGSTAYKLLAESVVDVLVVPKGASFRVENILVPTDGSGHAQRAGFKAINLAKHLGAKLHILSVIEFEHSVFGSEVYTLENIEKLKEAERKSFLEAQNILLKRCEAEGVPAEVKIEEGLAFETILAQAKTKGADLIVMGSYGKTGLRKIFLGSVAEKVVGLSEIPVLVVKS